MGPATRVATRWSLGLPAAVALISLVAAFGVSSGDTWTWFGADGWVVAPAHWLSFAAATIGTSVALGLAWVQPEGPAARHLAWLTAILGVSFFASLQVSIGELGQAPAARLMLAATCLGLLFACAAWIRFALAFPEPLSPAQFGVQARVSGLKGELRGSWLVMTMRRLDLRQTRSRQRKCTSGAERRRLGGDYVRRWYKVRTGTRDAVPPAMMRFITAPWRSYFLLALGVAPLSFWAPKFGLITTIAVCALGFLAALGPIATGVLGSSPAARPRRLWVGSAISSVQNGYLLFTAVVVAFLVGGTGGALGPYLRHGISLSISAAYFGFIGSLFMAVFWHGALDPELVLRRSTLYGTLTVALFVVFEVAEQGVGVVLTRFIPLPDSVATLAGAGAVALLATPLHRRIAGRGHTLLHRGAGPPEAVRAE